MNNNYVYSIIRMFITREYKHSKLMINDDKKKYKSSTDYKQKCSPILHKHILKQSIIF